MSMGDFFNTQQYGSLLPKAVGVGGVVQNREHTKDNHDDYRKVRDPRFQGMGYLGYGKGDIRSYRGLFGPFQYLLYKLNHSRAFKFFNTKKGKYIFAVLLWMVIVCVVVTVVTTVGSIISISALLASVRHPIDIAWTAPQQVFVPFKANLIDFGVDIGVTRVLDSGANYPVTATVVAEKPVINKTMHVSTYKNLKLDYNNAQYFGCYLTPFSTITVDYTFMIEDATTADPRFYIVNTAQMARFFKPNGKYIKMFQAAKKQSGSFSFSYEPSTLPLGFDIEQPSTYSENLYQGEMIYVVLFFPYIARTAAFEDSQINFITFEKAGLLPVEPVSVYEFNMITNTYETKHIDTKGGVGVVYNSKPGHQGAIQEAEFQIHSENTLHLTETIICVLAIIILVGLCCAFGILFLSFSAFWLLMFFSKKKKNPYEIYTEIKDQQITKGEPSNVESFKPLLNTTGATPSTPSQDISSKSGYQAAAGYQQV